MPSASPPTEQFWLLTGEVPSGPFSVAQVHAELAAGRATWQTSACPVGASTWLPLVQTPGIGPSAPRSTTGTRVQDSPPPSVPVAAVPSTNESIATASLEGVFAAMSPAAASRSTADATASASSPATAPLHQDQSPKPTADPAANGPSQPNQFWLLVGAETTGPYRPSHIRAKIQSGELPPDAKARRVGTEVWVSLTEAIGTLPPPPAEPKTPVTSSVASPPAPPAPESQSFLQALGLPPQTIQVGIGVLLMAAFLGLANSCKEDAKNQPTLQERLKEQRNNNPLPPVPPPKTTP